MTAHEIIESLGLQPLPVEGGYYTVTHRSTEVLSSEGLPTRYQNDRSISGAIYYLATVTQFSAMHKLLTDELYYYHLGDPLQILMLGPDGNGMVKLLGVDLADGQQPQLLVPRNWWQGSRPLPGGTFGFTLISTSMAPAYEASDTEFGNKERLMSQYPEYAETIASLTRK